MRVCNMTDDNKKEEKAKKNKEEKHEIDYTIHDIRKAWNTADYSEFMYSGTATGITTSSATMTSIFGGTDFYKTWEKKMEGKKYCSICKMYFSPYLSKCPVCGRKVK